MSTYVDATSGATEHCEAMATLHADLAEEYQEISRLVSAKLWHQVTLKLLSFLQEPKNYRTTQEGTSNFLALYDKVVLCIDKKLNPLALARIATCVSYSLLMQDGTAALHILENLLEQKETLGTAATLYCESKLAFFRLKLLEMKGQAVEMAEIKSMVQRNETTLQELTLTEDLSLVHSAHYQCSMTYRKAVGPPEAFFHQALNYLHYTTPENIEDAHQLAVDLSLAALTGEGVFEFGKLIKTPILASLKGTPHEWLMDLMHASSQGDVVQFQALLQKYATEISKEPALTHRAQAIQEKITLLALVHLVFERPSSERTLKFQEISDRIHLPVDQVELVVMRALSLHLVEGSMDQVSQEFQVTWVMPRVLDDAQLMGMASRFGEWAVKVSKTRDYMEQQTPTFA